MGEERHMIIESEAGFDLDVQNGLSAEIKPILKRLQPIWLGCLVVVTTFSAWLYFIFSKPTLTTIMSGTGVSVDHVSTVVWLLSIFLVFVTAVSGTEGFLNNIYKRGYSRSAFQNRLPHVSPANRAVINGIISEALQAGGVPAFARVRLAPSGRYEFKINKVRSILVVAACLSVLSLAMEMGRKAGAPARQAGSGALATALQRYAAKDYANALPSLLAAAGEGDVQAQALACESYLLGRGVPRNHARAAEWCRPAADAGSPLAQGILGMFRLNGGVPGVPKDTDAAKALIEAAAAGSDPRAVRLLGNMAYFGLGRAQDDAAALAYFTRAAKLGDANAFSQLGMMRLYGRGTPMDAPGAVEFFRRAAGQNDADGLFWLGWVHLQGVGAPQDGAESLRWTRAAVAQGSANAEWLMGELYREGVGVAKDQAEAARWYRIAADRGHAGGQRDLGVAYYFGEGIPADHAKAAQWYALAAAQGDASAQARLADLYERGDGVPASGPEAFKWYASAAAGGSVLAQKRTGDFYFNGTGGAPQDNAKALAWYLKAADANGGTTSDQAALLAGGLLYDGVGTSRNVPEARRWLTKAAASADPTVVKLAQQGLAVVNAPPVGVAPTQSTTGSTPSLAFGKPSAEGIVIGSIIALGLLNYIGSKNDGGLPRQSCRELCASPNPHEYAGCMIPCVDD